MEDNNHKKKRAYLPLCISLCECDNFFYFENVDERNSFY